MENSFKPTATIENLQARARILKAIRSFFDERDFFEVETPTLSHDIVVDRHLEPIEIDGNQMGVASERGQILWMQTSPEFAMKRIVAAGALSIYQIARCFRAGERGILHNPEFTMLEWYRVGDDMRAGISLLESLINTILQPSSFKRMSYGDVFAELADCDVLSEDVRGLRSCAERNQIDTDTLAGCDDLDEWRNLLLTQVIEPKLDPLIATTIYDWPASQAALARTRNEKPPVAERFELFYRGVELANGYHELLDPVELQARNRKINQQRLADGNKQLPADSRLLLAMEKGLPACSGVALGIDRLVMLATDTQSIDDVIAFPIELS